MWEMQGTARTDAVHCRGGCSALQGRLQCTASERGKAGTEIASPILDKRKGREKGLYMEHCSPHLTSSLTKYVFYNWLINNILYLCVT